MKFSIFSLFSILINTLCVLALPAGNQPNLRNVGQCYEPIWALAACSLFSSAKYTGCWTFCSFNCFREESYVCRQACLYKQACGCMDNVDCA